MYMLLDRGRNSQTRETMSAHNKKYGPVSRNKCLVICCMNGRYLKSGFPIWWTGGLVRINGVTMVLTGWN